MGGAAEPELCKCASVQVKMGSANLLGWNGPEVVTFAGPLVGNALRPGWTRSDKYATISNDYGIAY